MKAVRVSRMVRADSDRVFDAWTKIDTASEWLFRTPDGELVEAISNPEVGGEFTITEKRGEELAKHRGAYTALERPSRVEFDFWTGDSRENDTVTRVKVSISQAGDGAQVSLAHEGVPNEWEDISTKGWTKVLEKLAEVVEN